MRKAAKQRCKDDVEEEEDPDRKHKEEAYNEGEGEGGKGCGSGRARGRGRGRGRGRKRAEQPEGVEGSHEAHPSAVADPSPKQPSSKATPKAEPPKRKRRTQVQEVKDPETENAQLESSPVRPKGSWPGENRPSPAKTPLKGTPKRLQKILQVAKSPKANYKGQDCS